MDKEGARYPKLEQRRKQVARLHRKRRGIVAIVRMTGLSYPAVRLTIDLDEQGRWQRCTEANFPGGEILVQVGC